MRKNIWGLLGIVLALFSGFFIRCGLGAGSEPELIPSEPEFISSEYTIPLADAQEILNIEPYYIHSRDETVVTAKIGVENIVITSKRSGGTVVYVGDAAGLSNSASIDIEVNESGVIIPAVRKFQGNKVKAVIKEDIRIAGTVNTEITPAVIRLMMDNNDFSGLEAGQNVSAWITNLPQGLTARITYIQAGDHPHEVNITISGNPQPVYSGVLTVIIPAENSANPWDVYVESNMGAQFEITG